LHLCFAEYKKLVTGYAVTFKQHEHRFTKVIDASNGKCRFFNRDINKIWI